MKHKFLAFFITIIVLAQPGWTSPWVDGKTYAEKTSGKFIFGAKNLLLGWTALFTEPVKYGYFLEKKKSWEGLCVGISKAVLYTTTGAIHLVTFPIPIDIPNMGEGILETSIKDQAAREQTKKTAPSPMVAEENKMVTA
jgi:hypothetical protein